MRARHRQSGRRAFGLCGLIVLLAFESAGAEAPVVLDDSHIPLWNTSAELRGGFGYKDNVLLGHSDKQGSAFWMTSAELLTFRLPSHGWQFNVFADASDVRYFESASVDSEQGAIAVVQLSKDLGRDWKGLAGLNYLFQNQVFDFSHAYTNEGSVGQIVGHTLSPRVSLRKRIGALRAETEFSVSRQWLAEPLDDYMQYSPRVTVGWIPGQRSDLAMSYQYSRLDYDNREQVGAAGAILTNTSLSLDSHLAEVVLIRRWDDQRRWETMTRLGIEACRDNGSGFFDYDAVRLSQRVRCRTDRWECTARAALNHYGYLVQTVGAADRSARQKTVLHLAVRIERKLTAHWKAHAGCEWHRSFSNLDFDDYSATTVSGGVALALSPE